MSLITLVEFPGGCLFLGVCVVHYTMLSMKRVCSLIDN